MKILLIRKYIFEQSYEKLSKIDCLFATEPADISTSFPAKYRLSPKRKSFQHTHLVS